MFEIGIMQGRVLPERPDAYQVFPTLSWRRELSLIRRLGFDCVELLFDRAEAYRTMQRDDARTVPSPTRWSDDEWPPARAVCADRLASVSAVDQPVVFDSRLGDVLRDAARFGAKIVVVPLLDANALNSPDLVQRLIVRWRAAGLLERARTLGVTLALESVLPAIELRLALAPHPRGALGLCYDIGNAQAAGRCPADEILELSDLVTHVHLKDRRVGGPNVPLGEGDVDFASCFDALERIGFGGAAVLETAYGANAPESAARHLRFVREHCAGCPT